MLFIIIGLSIIAAAEIATIVYKKAHKGSKASKTDMPRGYLYLFLSAAILSLITMWVYILNATIMSSGPPFLIDWLIGTPICLVIFSIMAYCVRALLKKLSIPLSALRLSVAIAVIMILLAVNVLLVASNSGRLLLQ